MFMGYEQQDSQELLLFLMDGLHEDMNKVKKRGKVAEQDNDRLSDEAGAIQAWNTHKKINNSIIVDLFQVYYIWILKIILSHLKKIHVVKDSFVPLKEN